VIGASAEVASYQASFSLEWHEICLIEELGRKVGAKMKVDELLIVIAVAVIWFVVHRWVLPAMGVKT
jgi:hypothetical protein